MLRREIAAHVRVPMATTVAASALGAGHAALEAGCNLVGHHPDIGVIAQEYTNMPPHAHLLREVLGLPVYDITTLVTWLQAGLRPHDFGAVAI